MCVSVKVHSIYMRVVGMLMGILAEAQRYFADNVDIYRTLCTIVHKEIMCSKVGARFPFLENNLTFEFNL